MRVPTILFPLATASLLLVSAAPGWAFNTLFMRDSAMSEMTDAEFELMQQSFQQALNDLAQGETLRWGSADAAHGSVTVGESFTHSGLECRRTRFENAARGKRGAGELRFCKDPDGRWKILVTSQ